MIFHTVLLDSLFDASHNGACNFASYFAACLPDFCAEQSPESFYVRLLTYDDHIVTATRRHM